jgi:PAS domain S-box-containing protein
MSTRRRVRLAAYSAFFAIALATVLQGVVLVSMERERRADAMAFARVSDARAESQLIAHRAVLAALPAPDRSAALAQLANTIERAGASLPVLEHLLAGELADEGMRSRFDAWKRAHEGLRDRASDLVRAGGLPPGLDIDAMIRPVLAEAESASLAAGALLGPLYDAVDRRARRVETALWLQAVFVIALLLLLALMLIEPMVRSVERRLAVARGDIGPIRRLAHVAEYTAAAVIITDRRDRIRWTNRGFTQIVGWTYDDVRGGLPVELLRHPDADEGPLQRLRNAVATGHGLRVESLMRHKDGGDVWIDLDLRPLRDSAGRVTGFIYVGVDITARVAEQGRQRLQWLALPVGVLVTAADGRILDVNREAERLLGLQPGRLLGRKLSEPGWRFERADRAPYRSADLPSERARRTGEVVNGEVVGVRHGDGSMRWALVHARSERGANGLVAEVLVTLVDITQRVEPAQQPRAATMAP